MLLQSQIAEIIHSQQVAFEKKDKGLIRNILDELEVLGSFALIITGIRRCGKSTLLLQLMDAQKENTLYLNFEDTRLAGFETSDFSRLGVEISEKGYKLLLFDEIQLIENWEIFVRQKLDEGYKVVITGSNATLLSGELGTKLTGRHISVELFPFSYKEFVTFLNLDLSVNSLQKYFDSGGFPEFVKNRLGSILNTLFDDILVRDIAVRYGIRDVSTLRKLAIYLISNIGKPVSAKKLVSLFSVKATSTILDYLHYLENAYLFQFLPMFSYSLKVQSRNPRKVYSIDLGMFMENSVVFSEEKGRRLENLIYIHLRRKFKQLYYFKDNGECDFIALDRGKVQEVIQVCYELNDLNSERELNGITVALNFFNIKEGKIVTWNQKDIIVKDEKKIELIPAWEFLSADRDNK